MKKINQLASIYLLALFCFYIAKERNYMSAGHYDIDLIEGSGIDGDFFCTDSNNDPIDFGGYSARASFKISLESEVPYLDLTTGNGGIVFGDGSFRFVLTEEQYLNIIANGGVWEMELYPSGLAPISFLEGNVFTKRGAIHDPS